ncbi:MAG: hypothetical protein AAF441_22640 [Pseudomonadota bacterium]
MSTRALNREKLSGGADALIVVTTCSRPDLLKRHLAGLRDKIRDLECADLLVAIDGLSVPGNQESLEAVRALGVGALVAEHSEGVGVSKNRVVGQLGGYSHYFFLDDDVEVLSPTLFSDHMEISGSTGIHHFSLHDDSRLAQEMPSSELPDGRMIRHAMYGGAAVNYFTAHALECVGGWHPAFAKLRRGGHTEHSYRVFRAGLAPAPFNFVEALAETCAWHNPPSVVSPKTAEVADTGVFQLEEDLMAQEIDWHPFSASHPGTLVAH